MCISSWYTMSMKCVYSRQMTTIYSIVWFLGQMVIVSTELKPPPPTDLPSGYPLPSNRTLPRKPGVIRLGYMTGSDEQPGDMFYNKPGQAISGAITLAIKEVNEQTEVLPDHKLEFVIAETYGQEEVSIRETVLMRQKNISAYIGPQETCIHEARLAAAFNLPMISYFCTTQEVSDKTLYPTFTRTKPHDSQISKAVVALLLRFSWHKLVFVYNDEKPVLAKTIKKVLNQNGIQVIEAPFDGPYFPDTEVNESPFAKLVHDTYQRTRVYLMLADFYEYEGLMVALKLKGLLDTGEYIVVGVDSKDYDYEDPHKYVEGLRLSAHKNFEVVREVSAAFQGILLVMPAAPFFPWFVTFTKVVNEYLEAPPFNFTNAYKEKGILKILRPEAAYLYDAVWLYARAAHQALREGDRPDNGTLIAKLIQGTAYRSVLGYMNRIDEHGNCQGNFTLLARKYRLQGTSEYGMFPVGTFALSENNTDLPELQFITGEKIEWIGGHPPVDEPDCGFLGEKCLPGPNHTKKIVGGVVGGLCFVVMIVGILAYRNWKYEQELASLLWKIDYKDITMRVHQSQYMCSGGLGMNRIGASLRASMVSLSSQVDLDLRQVFTQVGTYKNSIVAVKPINKRCVDVTRTLQKEMKMMRDLRHDNLNAFVGACVDPNKVCIITEYCARGSLQDILANDDVKLDNMFIASLVFDILKGMTFLHDSEIRVHGRLKSSNCVVDSRWVLKVTDYGLWEFKDGQEVDNDVTEHTYYQGLLWTAPEILRHQTQERMGTQKGDIFSFAIILYEIHGREGCYGDTDLSPKQIVHRLMRSDGDCCFRPPLSALSRVAKHVTDCIKECWSEDPLIRPDFKMIRRALKPMQKGMKANIFDNMMAIMEKYATNLEDIVDDRTDQLREEKKKTEELLHQMLPRSVADQLKQGKRVEAESFDSVTIYFSDICGFTAMSSESTPMQIVDLLNDLYTTFDSILENYDVYKVETIGDAYMVVSGLPKRNGIQHAGEIASMSLHLLTAITRFKIRHRPDDTLKLRIGIHSGPCVAGVVGLKMPRFCLFGDTVNTASRMESNGQPLKINCSEATYSLLSQLQGYTVFDRGLINMKGKGQMRTYFVTGEDKQRRMSRLVPPKPVTTSQQTGSPKSPRRPNRNRSPQLQKIQSAPLIKCIIDDVELGCLNDSCQGGQTGKASDHILSNCNNGAGGAGGDGPVLNKALGLRVGVCASDPSLTPILLRNQKRDNWVASKTKSRRSASVKIKLHDEYIPEHGVVQYGERSLEDLPTAGLRGGSGGSGGFTGSTCATPLVKPVDTDDQSCSEGSPLLNREERSPDRYLNGNLRRQSSGETCV